MNNNNTCLCKECGYEYTFENNNNYGYLNCCFSCGENKYQDSIPQLNFDMVSKILNMRMNMKKDDKYKNNYNAVMRDMETHNEEINYYYDHHAKSPLWRKNIDEWRCNQQNYYNDDIFSQLKNNHYGKENQKIKKEIEWNIRLK
tara:strand:- start:1158 stop:1589 length:432 start_codon:yes stop_codon:yes gene_type:complete